MKYDILMVGAGITTATLCAKLKHKYKILVIETRPYIGGNCADSKIGNNYIQLHGCHNFHTPDVSIIDFLSKFTTWDDVTCFSVTGEIKQNGQIKRVPFPYSQETEAITGTLNEQEIINIFFKSYSQKMWGAPFEMLPEVIRKKVPKKTGEKSIYFPGHIRVHPTDGYTRMMEKMFDGVDMLLNADPDYWKHIPADHIFYSGRPDLIVGEKLRFRSVKFEWRNEEWDADTICVNFCHDGTPYTRKTSYGMQYGIKSRIVSYETPYEADDEVDPYYPYPEQDFESIKAKVQSQWPNLRLVGRLGTMEYMDIWQAVSETLNISKNYLQK